MAQPAANFLRSFSHILAAVFNDRAAFNRLWRDSGARGHQPGMIAVRWQGDWVSEANGHQGELRCLLRWHNSTQLEARFCATYARWLRVCYTVSLAAQEDSGPLRLKGEADLGMLAGGIYKYEGELSQTHFKCSYRCKYDHGTFHLKPLS